MHTYIHVLPTESVGDLTTPTAPFSPGVPGVVGVFSPCPSCSEVEEARVRSRGFVGFSSPPVKRKKHQRRIRMETTKHLWPRTALMAQYCHLSLRVKGV